jgi:non-specific serine/threonine protein kinase/serine/threonine-protein kinase
VSNTGSWERLQELFHRARDLEEPERSQYLDGACGDDAALRGEVDGLLAAAGGAGTFAPPSARTTAAAPAGYTDVPHHPTTIGCYRIIRRIAEGGMGSVYLARRADQAFEKQVAIKVIKRGMDSDAIVSRFRRERQTLAGLDHANIAGLLDGGASDEGLPYFVMDYVDGVPIDQYCDSHRLSTDDRLGLFLSVCAAVQHAHRNLVVHRDLKPDNILVTPDGCPKLLDFGIAKVLSAGTEDAGDMTAAAARYMTLRYASPEQVRGEPVTTATDVYSLGVLLYELLTGHRPYGLQTRTPADVARAICEREPEPPSVMVTRTEECTGVDGHAVTVTPQSVSATRGVHPARLRRRLAGDLDRIVSMALRKEPERRYASVEQFARDIRRHLKGLPVNARKSTAQYRAGKFVRRHRASVAAAALTVVLLLGGILATGYQARVAGAERARAERRFGQVRQLANGLLFEFHDAIATVPGATAARQLVVRRALEYLDSLAAEAGGDAGLQAELATAFERLGDVQGNFYRANTGEVASSLTSYRKALAIRKALAASAPSDQSAGRHLAAAHDRLADALFTTSSVEEALAQYREGQAIRERLATADPDSLELRRDLSISANKVGHALMLSGNSAGARDSYARAVALTEALLQEQPGSSLASRDAGLSYGNLGDIQARMGAAREGLESHKKALALLSAIATDDAPVQRQLATTLNKVGDMLSLVGENDAALERYREAYAIREKLSIADATNAQARRDLSISLIKIGDVLSDRGALADAESYYRRAVGLREALLKADAANKIALRDLSVGYERIGEISVRRGDRTEALRSYKEALAIDERLAQGDASNANARRDLAISHENMGDLQMHAGALREATESYRRSASLREALASLDRASEDARRDLENSYWKLGSVSVARAAQAPSGGREQAALANEACDWYRKGQAIFEATRNVEAVRADTPSSSRFTAALRNCG